MRARPAPAREPNQFGPHVPELARLIAVSPVDSLAFLVEVDRRWPGLSFRDFMAANVLAAAIVMPTEGTA
jgi:hypothetical protein